MSITIGVLDLATGALGAGVVAAFANQGPVWIKEWLRDGRALKLRRQHAALALAVSLERYALACAHAVEAIRQGLAETVLYHNPSYARVVVPDLVLPEATDWQCLSAALAARVLKLPLEIRYAQQQVDIVWNYEDNVAAAKGAIPLVGRLG
ncbi:hypothetical protein ACEN2Y_00765 (plasmid) [Ralstonia solanacearum]|uniref:hypothetical protein n=1 Tax=Ralstonia solanacearum TaxID=305 RepID=UPI003216566C